MKRFVAIAALILAAPFGGGSAVASQTSVQPDAAAMFEEVRQADLKLATIGWRLASSNVALCARREAGFGIQIHTLDQFEGRARAAAEAHFRFETPVAIEAVVPNGPGERAGLRPDDSLVRVGSVDLSSISGKPGSTDRLVATQFALAALPVEKPVEVEVLRRGSSLRFTVTPMPTCKSRFELRLSSDFRASADGSMVQISSSFLETYPEQQVAAVVAHELSHNILHHRDRLNARGVSFGMLSGFGANVKYFRQTEIQADLLSAYLLANAGYDPHAPIAFWKTFGPSKAGGIFRTRSHPHWRDRIATLTAEIAKIGAQPAQPARPIVPALVSDRDQPLDGDWQSLLIRN